MNIEEVRKMQEDKDDLLRHEGKHPANYNEEDLKRVHALPEHIRSAKDARLYHDALKPFMNQ